MKVESITFLSDVKDIFDDNVDVAVKLDDGHEYIVVLATQKNLLTLMNKLTKEVIEDAIQVYAENNSYYLKYLKDFNVKYKLVKK